MKNTSDQAITIGDLRIEAGAEIPAEFASRRSLIKMFGADPVKPAKPDPVKPAGGPPVGGPPPAPKPDPVKPAGGPPVGGPPPAPKK